MSAGTLLLGSVLSLATAVLYVHVGHVTLKRTASDAAGRTALRLFALWWFGLAVLTAIGVVQLGVAIAGGMDVDTYQAISLMTVLPLVAILYGLVSYLAYIYTGSPRVFVPVGIFHVGVLAYLFYLVGTLRPDSLALGDWGITAERATEPDGSVTAVVLALILLPALAAALGYASLYFRTKDRSARYRIAMVSGAFLLWFGSSGVAGAARLGEWGYWPLVSRGIALVSTLMVLAAYRPPRWLREHYGLRSTDENAEPTTTPATWRTARATLIRLAPRRA